MLDASFVLENAVVVTADRVERRDLAVSHGRVAHAAASGALRIDMEGHFVFPTLVNAHDHLQLNCIPPLECPGGFADSYAWIDAYERFMKTAEVATAVSIPAEVRFWQGGYKNLLSGTTTVAHHDPPHAALNRECYPVAVVEGLGWCHSLRLGAPRGASAPRYGPDVAESFNSTTGDVPWVIHLAEGTSVEAREELARLDAMGLLAERTVIVHGVGLSVADMARVIEQGAAVVWCPSSNTGMFGTTLDPDMLGAAGRLALGTDSRLTGGRDMLDEMRTARSCSRLSSREVFRLATDCGRTVLRLEVAQLEPGQQADCLIIRGTGNPYDALLDTARSGIRAVVRSGVVKVADPDLAAWFAHAASDVRAFTLDGNPKLMASEVFRADALSLESGIEVS